MGDGTIRRNSVLRCRFIDAWTTLNAILVKSKFVFKVISQPKFDIYIIAIPPTRDGD